MMMMISCQHLMFSCIIIVVIINHGGDDGGGVLVTAATMPHFDSIDIRIHHFGFLAVRRASWPCKRRGSLPLLVAVHPGWCRIAVASVFITLSQSQPKHRWEWEGSSRSLMKFPRTRCVLLYNVVICYMISQRNSRINATRMSAWLAATRYHIIIYVPHQPC